MKLRIVERIHEGKLRHFVQCRRFLVWKDATPPIVSFLKAAEVQLDLRADQSGGPRPWLRQSGS